MHTRIKAGFYEPRDVETKQFLFFLFCFFVRHLQLRYSPHTHEHNVHDNTIKYPRRQECFEVISRMSSISIYPHML